MILLIAEIGIVGKILNEQCDIKLLFIYVLIVNAIK